MSCNVVTKECIDSIIYALVNRSKMNPNPDENPQLVYGNDLPHLATLAERGNSKGRDAFGRMLWSLNAEAWKQRYTGTHYGASRQALRLEEFAQYQEEAEAYEYDGPLFDDVTMEDFAQATNGCLDCLIYQCSEGDITESAIYNQLKKLRRSMMDELTNQLLRQNDMESRWMYPCRAIEARQAAQAEGGEK